MKSYEEMTQSVLERGDRYFRRKEKRIAAVKKGAPFMSLFGIFTLVGLGLLSSPANDAPTPDTPQQIEIVETQTEVQTVTEIETVTETAAVSETVNTSSDNESTYFSSTGTSAGTSASSPNPPSLPDSPKAAFTTAPSNNSKFTVSAAAVTDIIVKETAAGDITENTNEIINPVTDPEKDDNTFVDIGAEEQASGTWGSNTSWALNDTTLTISGNGAIDSISYFANVYHNKFGNAPDKFKEDYPWSEYYDIITDVIIEDGITSIPVGAFCYYPELKNVELPDSLLSIEDNSFICCNNLREITIPENAVIIDNYIYAEPFGYPIWTYDTVSGISSDELEEMAAFYETERRNAKNYHLTINGYDYSSSYYYCISYNCSFNSLGTAKNPFIAPRGSAGNGITWSFSDMGTMTFSGNGVIESAGLDSAAIEAAPYVRKVAFDNGITGIGDFAFSEFDSIEEVEFSDTVTEIGDAAFTSSMKTMGSVIIPKSVKKIGNSSICTKNGKIYGYSGTTAETYAVEKNMVFVAMDKTVSGDINCDGVVNLNDATSILSFYADMSAGCSTAFDADEKINTFLTGIADINNDGKIDISDATLILNYYAESAAGMK